MHGPSFVVCLAAQLVGASEYAVVMPSLLAYLSSLGSHSEAFYGLVLGSFSLARLISVPLSGHAADHYSMRWTLGLLLVVGACGNFAYATANSRWMVLAGRFACGLGSASGPVVFAFVSRSTTQAQRTRFVSLLSGAALVALAGGPALNLALVKADFRLGPFVVNPERGVGWLLLAMQIVLVAMVALMFRDPPEAPSDAGDQEDEGSDNSNNQVTPGISNISININNDRTGSSDGLGQNAETKPVTHLPGWKNTTSKGGGAGRYPPLRFRLKRLISQGPVWVCLLIVFVAGFGQTAIEGLLTVITTRSYDWDAVQNSVLFSVVAGEILLVTLTVAAVSKRVSDRSMIGTGALLSAAGLVLCSVLWTVPMPLSRFAWPLSIVLTGLPLLQMPSRSLYSKCASQSDQGMAQSVWVMSRAVANVLGPSVSAAVFQHWGVKAAIAGVAALVVAVAAAVALRWETLVVPAEDHDDLENPLLIQKA